MTDQSQVKSQLLADSLEIFSRILFALGVANASQAAQKLNLAKQSVYEWQKNPPSLESLVLIAKSGNASLDWILTGIGDPFFSQGKKNVNLDEVLSDKIQAEINKNIPNLVRKIARDVIKEEINLGLFAKSLENKPINDSTELQFHNRVVETLKPVIERVKLAHNKTGNELMAWENQILSKISDGILSYESFDRLLWQVHNFNNHNLQWVLEGQEPPESKPYRNFDSLNAHRNIRSFWQELIKIEKLDLEEQAQKAKVDEETRILNLIDERIQKTINTSVPTFTTDVVDREFSNPSKEVDLSSGKEIALQSKKKIPLKIELPEKQLKKAG